MKFTHLKWDSDFFNKKIGKLEFELLDTEEALQKEIASRNDYDLLYVFTPEHVVLKLPADDPKCVLVDTKIVYQKQLELQDDEILKSNVLIKLYEARTVSKELVALAYQSGEYSRYRVDPNISNDFFERLYKQWMINSVNGSYADHVYVAMRNHSIQGMMTIKNNGTASTIGLFAVDHQARGMKVGYSLFQHAIQRAFKDGMTSVLVATQRENEAACRFYEKNGFSKKYITNIYHYWVK